MSKNNAYKEHDLPDGIGLVEDVEVTHPTLGKVTVEASGKGGNYTKITIGSGDTEMVLFFFRDTGKYDGWNVGAPCSDEIVVPEGNSPEQDLFYRNVLRSAQEQIALDEIGDRPTQRRKRISRTLAPPILKNKEQGA